MIYDILEVFQKEYDEKGDKLILDNYILKDGLYVKINRDESIEYFIFENDKKIDKKENCFKNLDGNICLNMYEWFKVRDYYSSYLNSNKSFFDKKLHNINYLSLFVKMESFIGSDLKKRLSKKAIRGQFLLLLNYKKFNKREEKEILKSYDNVLNRCSRKKDIVKKYRFIENNIKTIVNMAIDNNIKNYIKIFFDESIDKYQEESEIYYAIKIFNNIDYSKKIKDDIFGLSDSNLGMGGGLGDSKKPFFQLKTRKIVLPFMLLKEDALTTKKFFDWLKYQDLQDKYPITNNIFINRDYKKKDLINDFDYLPIKIEKFDTPIVVKNYLQIYKHENYEITELWQLESRVDELLYNKQLIFNYFRDDIKISNFLSKELQNILFITKFAMINYFKKFDDREFYQVVQKYGDRFVVIHLKNGYEQKAKGSLNLKLSLLKYKGEEIMNIEKMFENIKDKLDSSDYKNLSQEEFYFLSGQVAYYLLAQKEQHQKKQDLLEPYLRCNNAKKLKKEIEFSFFQYKHALSFNYKKFNNALSLIQAYEGEEKMSSNMDSFLVGYLSNNLFFEKKES